MIAASAKATLGNLWLLAKVLSGLPTVVLQIEDSALPRREPMGANIVVKCGACLAHEGKVSLNI